MSLPYSILIDKTNFPLISRKDWKFYISLFPVSKYQFEQFLSDDGLRYGYTDSWYRQLLEISPRNVWWNCKDKPWQLFITGLCYEHITYFFKYLGKSYRLPTIEEWKMLYNNSDEIKSISDEIKKLLLRNQQPLASPVICWLENKLLPLTKEGLLEMVKDNKKIYYIGRPYQGLLPNTWQPEQIREVNWELCRGAVGFRLSKER